MGFSGIIINFIIIKTTGKEALGVFNQVYALYAILAQLGAGGIHFSILRDISFFDDSRKKAESIAGALLLSSITSLIIIIFIWYIKEYIGLFFNSINIAKGLSYALPGIYFFVINKVLINIINGANHMRAFALYQSIRYLLTLVFITILIIIEKPYYFFPISLTASEVILTIILIPYCLIKINRPFFNKNIIFWIKRHWTFGTKGFLSGLLTTANTRIDILMLGIFVDDNVVGIYSFTSMITDGFSQIPLIIRKNIDPLFGKCFSKNNIKKIEKISSNIRRVFFPIMLIIIFISIVIYYFSIKLIISGSSFDTSLHIFIILMFGIAINSLYRPFKGIFMQGGRPGYYTLMVIFLTITNITLNTMLIPYIHIYGAAISTSMVYILESISVFFVAKRLFKINL